MRSKPLRILYAAGPGNVLGTYLHWREGKDDPSQVAMTYSGQFYDLCRELGAKAYVIATCRTPGRLRDGNVKIIHRPVPFEESAGIVYHLGQFYYGLRLLISAVRMRADVAVVCTGTHWFVLWLMTLFGTRVVPTLHCVLWTKYRWRPTRFQRWVHVLNGWFFGARGMEIIAVSDEITQQVSELTDGRARPATRFVPQYRRASFANVRPPDERRDPFRVLYVGRVERNKGVFDVVAIARQFAADGVTGIEFDLCGAGGALAELRAAIGEAGLSAVVRCHGHCDHATMTEMYGRSHVVIVPTTTDFIEGFNKVVAEGVLAGRPVITSSVCPALALVRGSVLEVQADDAGAYAAAILRLRDDRALYQAKRRACVSAEGQFYDPSQGWAATLKAVLEPLTMPDRGPRRPTFNWTVGPPAPAGAVGAKT